MDLLLKELKDAPCFVISFDEFFNEELEVEQMDFIVRYFKAGKVKSRYLSSGFLGHTTAKDLKRAFEECTEKLDLKNLIQVSYLWTRHQLENARLDCRRQELK